MEKQFYYIGLLLILLAVSTSCNKNKGKEDDPSAKTLTDLDVSAYDKWVYVSFASGTPEVKGIHEPAPAEWDIALHRENVKTNGGSAMETEKTSLAALTRIPDGRFVPDTMTTDVVVVDLSQMMTHETIVYDSTEVNMVLNAWVTRSGMPPAYTVKDRVFVVKTKEGKYAKIKFTSFKSVLDKTGFATFSYVYPF